MGIVNNYISKISNYFFNKLVVDYPEYRLNNDNISKIDLVIKLDNEPGFTDKTKIVAYARRDVPQATSRMTQELVQINVTFNKERLGFTDFEIKNYFE